MARRLEDILPSVISPDQTGFIKRRHSFYNIRWLFNILYSPKHVDSECLASMDAEKAFDRVEWNYLFCTLEKFGFSSVFLSWIKTLYRCPLASVLTNSHYSEYFDLHRGTRQGCPLSPLLFAIAIEPLAIALHSGRWVQGIWRGRVEHKVSLYADDLLLFVSKPATSLPEALTILDDFSQFSGYKLNLNKSELFPVNKEALKFDYTDLPLKVVKDHFNYLGICVTREFKNLFKSNFLTLFDQAKQILSGLLCLCPLLEE